MGFTLLGLEMLLLLGFQALYGYVYQQLSILVALFMVGMATGAWLALKSGTPRRGGSRTPLRLWGVVGTRASGLTNHLLAPS